MLLIALTGGIGSGKSTAAAFFRQCGAEVIEADQLAREVLAVGTPGLAAVQGRFGVQVIHADGSLNREALARIIFADPDQRAALEQIVHPLVQRSFQEKTDQLSGNSVVVYEIPLLVEVGRADEFQLVIAIETPLSMRIERIAKRGLTQNQAMARISEQASNAERRAIADIVLTNSKDETSFTSALATTWDLRLKPFAENLAANRGAQTGPLDYDSLPNLLPVSKQIERIATRIGNAVGEKVEIISPRELKVVTDEDGLAAKFNHLGLVEIEPDLHFASADPGRSLNLVIAEK